MGTYNDKEKEFFYVNEDKKGSKTIRSIRPTKSQALINFKLINKKMELILNRQKLNEFPGLIFKFNENTDFKLNALKKHVFFNFEFIYAKILCEDLRYLRESQDLLLDICKSLIQNKEACESIQDVIALNTILLKYSLFLKKHPNAFIDQIRTRFVDHVKNNSENKNIYLINLLNDNYKKMIDLTWKYNQLKNNSQVSLSADLITSLVPMNTFLETNLNLNESVLFSVDDWNAIRFWPCKINNVNT
jgi:hypothetical protein